MKSIKTKVIAIRIIMAGMVLGKSGKQYDASADGPYGDHATVIISIATGTSEPRRFFNATD
jgi:hypothetical protein